MSECKWTNLMFSCYFMIRLNFWLLLYNNTRILLISVILSVGCIHSRVRCRRIVSSISLFLCRVKECQILLLNGHTKGCFLPAPYLDNYGETDQGLKWVLNFSLIVSLVGQSVRPVDCKMVNGVFQFPLRLVKARLYRYSMHLLLQRSKAKVIGHRSP